MVESEQEVTGVQLGLISLLVLELSQDGFDPLQLGVLRQRELNLFLGHFELLAHTDHIVYQAISVVRKLADGILQILTAGFWGIGRHSDAWSRSAVSHGGAEN